MTAVEAEGALHGRCDCGEVTLTLASRPDRLNACACDYCRRVGARWGYLPGGDVRIEGATVPYRRATRNLEFRRCEICGVVTHWQPHGKPADQTVGVNMANFEDATLHDIPVGVDP